MALTFRAAFTDGAAFTAAFDQQIRKGGLLVAGAVLPPGAGIGPCRVAIDVGGAQVAEVDAQIAAAVPGVGVAVMFPGGTAELGALAERARRGEALGSGAAAAPAEESAPAEDSAEDVAAAEAEEPPARVPQTMLARLQGMTVTEKMQLGLSGDRDARVFLLRDTNKALHLYVLRNPRIGLDEVQYAARLSTISPEALKYIAEHKEWGLSPTICASIARNPKAPVPLVLRILPRVPLQDLRAIAKGTGRAPIVQAARKMLVNMP